MIRSYSSNDPVRNPDPATDPFAYNQLCMQNPMAQDCGLPLYWPAPPNVLKATAGMHRFQWDLHYDPLPGAGGGGRGGGGGNGAVPGRTYTGVNSPWVAPGTYSVRLTADGKSMTQPVSVKMDPRVKITPAVQQIFTISTQMEDNARNARAAYSEARALVDKVRGASAIRGLMTPFSNSLTKSLPSKPWPTPESARWARRTWRTWWWRWRRGCRGASQPREYRSAKCRRGTVLAGL